MKDETLVQAKYGDTVSVHYTGKLEDGTVFDTTRDRYPKDFTIGENQVIPGFENAIVGMKPGESKTVKVPMDQAYGPHYKQLVGTMDRERLGADMKLEVGQRLQFGGADGNSETIVATIIDISDKGVTLDGNHPLAGKDLFFEIELVEIMGSSPN